MGVVSVTGAQEQNSVSQSLLTKLGEQRGGVAGGRSPRPGGGRGAPGEDTGSQQTPL